MELKELINLYLRWLWLLIVGGIVGMSCGFVASKIQTPIYEASTKVLITRNRPQSGTDILSISDQQLVLTYQQLLKTRPLLDEAESTLNANIDADNIRVDIIPNTQIIQIKVEGKDRELVASIGNTLVQILIEQNETLQAGRYSIYEVSLNAQISQVQEQINDLQSQLTQINQANIAKQLELVRRQITDIQDQISNLENEIADFPSILSTVDRASLTEKQSQLDQLRPLLLLYQQIQTNLTFIGEPIQGVTGSGDPRARNLQLTLGLYQQLYLNLLNNLETVKLARVQSTPTVSQIEEAIVPDTPIRPIPLLYTVVSGMVGLLIAAGTVLLIDYFDDTLKSSQKIQEILAIPVIGEVAENRQDLKAGNLNLANRQNSLLTNAFGVLRIKVAHLLAQKSLKTVLITSPSVGEGKTTIALNLAEAFLQAGMKVLLMDADLYHPAIHSLLELENQRGLTEILAKGATWQEVVQDFHGISIITSGAYSAPFATLLESSKMSQLLKQLQKEKDIIIIDGPPLFVADAQILASKVGGILLVVRQGSTITSVARSMVDQLNLMGANVLGVVLNRVPRTATYHSDGYYSHIAEDKIGTNMEPVEPNQN
jgi:capsular exopolysaccharide synthesis family protein